MKEEEEKRIAQMTQMEFSKMTESAHNEADSWTESALQDVAQIDMMARGEPAPKRSLDSGPHSIPYTAKGERLLRERLERENAELPEELENYDNMSPDEKKAVEAERRAAWRKARLKSLENVRFLNSLQFHEFISFLNSFLFLKLSKSGRISSKVTIIFPKKDTKTLGTFF